LARYTELITQATDRSSKELFLTSPRAKIEVRRVPEFKEATAPGAYYDIAAMDGSRPGIFFANLRDMNEVPKWSMPTLAYHEGVPGHHWQISTAEELKGVPQFRKVIPFTAYMEGWALYCEWLAKQAGWYDNDPFGDLGRLRDELFRAVRLVVDTGIHAKHWTREQAIAYMREKTGMGEKEVKSEIERYIVAPGQACAYKVGMLKIQELRARAQKELGDKFDQREFHDAVLKNGALPLEILEEQVNDYIQRKKTLSKAATDLHGSNTWKNLCRSLSTSGSQFRSHAQDSGHARSFGIAHRRSSGALDFSRTRNLIVRRSLLDS
jgi:uncharacterized protein (DUF885 family)